MILILNLILRFGAFKTDLAMASYCSTTAMVGAEMKKQLKGIPRIVRPLFLCIQEWPYMQGPEKDIWLKCSMTMVLAFHMIESLKFRHSWEKQ